MHLLGTENGDVPGHVVLDDQEQELVSSLFPVGKQEIIDALFPGGVIEIGGRYGRAARS